MCEFERKMRIYTYAVNCTLKLTYPKNIRYEA